MKIELVKTESCFRIRNRCSKQGYIDVHVLYDELKVAVTAVTAKIMEKEKYN